MFLLSEIKRDTSSVVCCSWRGSASTGGPPEVDGEVLELRGIDVV